MRMKKLLGLLLAAALLVLGSVAFAEGPDVSFAASKVEYGRVGIEKTPLTDFIEGDISYSASSGLLKIKIDDKATDWEGILSHGGGAPYIILGLEVKNPDTTKYHRAMDFTGSVADQSEEHMQKDICWRILGEMQMVDDDCQNNGYMDVMGNLKSEDWRNGHEIGEVIKDQSMLEPQSTWGDYGAYLGWYNIQEMYDLYIACDKDGDAFVQAAMGKLKYEYFWCSIAHTTDEAFYVPVRFASKYCLAPSASVEQEPGVYFDAENFADDAVTFIVDPEVASRQPDVWAKLRPPKEIAHLVNEVELFYDDGQSEVFDLDDEGFFEIGGSYDTEELRVDERSFVVSWNHYDPLTEESTALDFGQFYMYIIPKNVQPWPAYVRSNNPYGLEWTPVPASRVHIEGANGGARCSYDENTGIFNVGFDINSKIVGEPGDIKVTVEAPAGAVWYRTNRSGGNRVMGKMMDHAEEMDHTIINPPSMGDEEADIWPKMGDVVIRESPVLDAVSAGPVTVYLQTEPVWRFGGAVNTIYWYDSFNADPLKPMQIEYICETFDELSIAVENPCIEKEEDIREPVKQITGVGKHCKNWKLVIRYDMQNGHKAIHYDLHMKNDSGAYQQLEEPVVFYIPYPDGTSYEGDHQFDLLHFNNDHTRCEKVEVSRTPYGIRFVVNSLSPFTLSWDDGIGGGGGITGGGTASNGGSIDMPATGDDTPVLLWSALLAIALCGMFFTKRKQKAK